MSCVRIAGSWRIDLVHDLVDTRSVTTTYNVHDAKTHFSRLLQRVLGGEEIVIAKAGKPVARIVPVRPVTQRRPDRYRDRIWIADDFDAPLPDELLDAFEGRS